jgi:hypothetical protein
MFTTKLLKDKFHSTESEAIPLRSNTPAIDEQLYYYNKRGKAGLNVEDDWLDVE